MKATRSGFPIKLLIIFCPSSCTCQANAWKPGQPRKKNALDTFRRDAYSTGFGTTIFLTISNLSVHPFHTVFLISLIIFLPAMMGPRTIRAVWISSLVKILPPPDFSSKF